MVRSRHPKLRVARTLVARATLIVGALLVVGATLTLPACAGDTAAPPGPSLSGDWSGGIGDGPAELEVTIAEDETLHLLEGSGRFVSELVSLEVTISGLHAHPAVSFTIRNLAGREQATYSGTVESETRIRGTISGPGFGDGVELDLTRTR